MIRFSIVLLLFVDEGESPYNGIHRFTALKREHPLLPYMTTTAS